jgi:hypothetical protein
MDVDELLVVSFNGIGEVSEKSVTFENGSNDLQDLNRKNRLNLLIRCCPGIFFLVIHTHFFIRRLINLQSQTFR